MKRSRVCAFIYRRIKDMLDFSICDVYRGDEAFLCKNVSGPHSYVLLITFLSAFLCTGDLCKGVAFAQKRRCTYFIQGQ